MIIYIFDKITNELTGSKEAQINPKHPEECLFPQNSTKFTPPTIGSNEIQVFNTAKLCWEIHKDYRGTKYYINEGQTSPYEIKSIGEVVPENASLAYIPQKIDETSHSHITQRRIYEYRTRLDPLVNEYTSKHIIYPDMDLSDLVAKIAKTRKEIQEELPFLD